MFSSSHWILKIIYISSIAIGFDTMHGEGNVDISPLVSLMKEQVQKLKNLAISAITLSDIKEDVKAVDKDVFSVIYRSPENFLKIVQWRKMLTSDIYREKLWAITVYEAHVIKQWWVIDEIKKFYFMASSFIFSEINWRIAKIFASLLYIPQVTIS